MLNLRTIIFPIGFLLLSNCIFSQDKDNKQKDIWSGKYQIIHQSKNIIDDQNSPFYIIEKTLDAKPENVTNKYENDLLRWHMLFQNDVEKDTVLLRRFLINDDDNEYEQFGWTALYKSGDMKCLDGGHFFICKTTVGSTVIIDEEKFISKTGYFGIMLHQGLFDLYKID